MKSKSNAKMLFRVLEVDPAFTVKMKQMGKDGKDTHIVDVSHNRSYIK